MPKPPVTISIVPSRLALGLHLSLALAALVIAVVYAPPWLFATAALCLGVVLWRYGRQRRGDWQLRFVDRGDVGGEWQLRVGEGSDWERRSLGCDYLGHWLVGLTLDGERRWLWPDSVSQPDGRALRRLLVAGKADGHMLMAPKA
ncbi:protein YgfX [Onishia taeanensis]